MATRRGRKVSAPVEDVEELEVIDDELEDLDVEEPEELEEAPPPRKRAAKKAPAKAPAKKAAAAAPVEKAESSGYDTNWLVDHVNETLDTEHDSRSIRMLLRRLARDGELTREIGVDRGRWEFPKGANDPAVKKILRAIQNGGVKAAKDEAIESAKTAAAAKKTPAKKAPAKTTRRRAAVVVEDDEE